MGVKINKKSKAPTYLEVKTEDGMLKEALGIVVKKHKDGSITEAKETVSLVEGQSPFANVGVRASRTFNLGDYNSVRVEVSLYMPCEVSTEHINTAYEFAKEWVDEKMNVVSEEVQCP